MGIVDHNRLDQGLSNGLFQTTQILNPDDWEVTNENIYLWRQILRLKLYDKRKRRSDLSGKSLASGFEMHEALFSRRFVPKSIWWHYKLFHEYNSMLLLPSEHRPSPPSREKGFEWAYELYGKENVIAWIKSLPWKVIPDFPT